MSYKRVLLKLSGESLKEKDTAIFNTQKLKVVGDMISQLAKTTEVCVVIGGGNIWRGRIAEEVGIERVPADFMGMLGTVINAVAVASYLSKQGENTLVTTALPELPGVTVAYSINEADKAMKEGKIVFLSGGTGKPYFSTDTTAAMRAKELNCDAILVGKNGVDGVYTADPKVDPDAKFLANITYKEMQDMKLKVIDDSAVEILKDVNVDVRIFSMDDVNNFIRVANGEHIGTILSK